MVVDSLLLLQGTTQWPLTSRLSSAQFSKKSKTNRCTNVLFMTGLKHKVASDKICLTLAHLHKILFGNDR